MQSASAGLRPKCPEPFQLLLLKVWKSISMRGMAHPDHFIWAWVEVGPDHFIWVRRLRRKDGFVGLLLYLVLSR